MYSAESGARAMFGKFLGSLRGVLPASMHRFEPLYSLEQLAAIQRFPIVRVLPFAPAAESSENGEAGPGVGGLLANLLRRNLLLTRQLSVAGVEDTGYLLRRQSDEMPLVPDEDVFDYCDVLIAGQLVQRSATDATIKLQIHRRDQEVQTLRLSFPYARVAEVGIALAKGVTARLNVRVAAALIEKWQTGQPRDWRCLSAAGTCWETEDLATLVAFAEKNLVHADALVKLSSCGIPNLERRGLSLAVEQDPQNAQLLFFLFCVTWKGNTRFQPEAAELLRLALHVSPGHGKSHMCLPHVIMASADNAPYILAHSQLGFEFLRNNSFALNNFCLYLQQHSPDDPRIRALFMDAIQLDPASPDSYCSAIDYLLSRRRPAEALEIAQSLVRLCTPPLDPRTLYCFRQNPSVAAAMDRGRFVPLDHARRYVAACEKGLGRG